MNSIDKQLIELYDEKNRKEKVRTHLTNLYYRIEEAKMELLTLQAQLIKEERDVEKLEENNIYSLFLTVLGTKKQQLEKERQEYIQMFIKVKGLEKNLEILDEEKMLLQKTFSGLENAEEDFEKLLKTKVHLLVQSNDYPEALLEYNEKIASYNIKNRELLSCIKKGDVAKNYLKKITDFLGELEVWGAVSNNSTKVKKKLRRINKDIFIANNFMQRYEGGLVELEDYFELDFHREIVQFETFLDQFVDALITDWIVKHRIFNASNLLINLSDKITQINEMLSYEIEKTESYIEEAEDYKADYILNKLKS